MGEGPAHCGRCHPWAGETNTEIHRDRQTRGTNTLRKTPSSRKKHTLIDTHRDMQTERDTHTERHTH